MTTREQGTRAQSGRRGLARGLESLIPTAPSVSSGDTTARAPIGSIAPNPSQPRREFDQHELEELAASIREHGVLQPLLVQPEQAGRYELIAGERRWRAAAMAGLDTVPIVIQQAGAEEADGRLTLALVENLQRSDLNPIETATAFEQLSAWGWTQERIASEVGKSRAAVANLLRLRRLPQAIQDLLASGALSEGHGRALLAAPTSQQESLAEQAVEAGWTVRQVEEAAKAFSSSTRKPPPQRVEPSAAMMGAAERLESALGTRVEVRAGATGSSSGGRIVIHWYDEEQLTELAAQIAGVARDQSDELEEFRI
ncbi:MAG: ParB/RepB/Spo0J family partition protein [Chloroflexi bacterium]|nr:ParB/RepB/Spo0J family partition protein [Chloroflexota bacterium]